MCRVLLRLSVSSVVGCLGCAVYDVVLLIRTC